MELRPALCQKGNINGVVKRSKNKIFLVYCPILIPLILGNSNIAKLNFEPEISHFSNHNMRFSHFSNHYILNLKFKSQSHPQKINYSLSYLIMSKSPGPHQTISLTYPHPPPPPHETFSLTYPPPIDFSIIFKKSQNPQSTQPEPVAEVATTLIFLFKQQHHPGGSLIPTHSKSNAIPSWFTPQF